MSNQSAEIRVYNSSLTLQAVFDDYETAYFTRSWNGVGEFQIDLNFNTLWASSLNRGSIIQIQGSSVKTGIITDIKRVLAEDGKPSQKISAHGVELKGLFRRRIVAVPAAQATYTIASSPAETIMKTLAGTEIGPAATVSDRRISIIQIALDQARGSSYLYSSAWSQTLADACEQVSLATSLGWYCYLDLTAGKIVFDCAAGTDRTSSVTAGQAIFSAERRTLRSAEYRDDDTNYANFAFTGGSGSGASRIIRNVPNSSAPTGITRQEIFVDASNFTTNSDLDAQGNQKLSEVGQLQFIDAAGLPVSPLVYQTDYDLGDLVTLYTYGSSIDSRITSVQESWSKLSYNLVLEFGKPYPSLPWQVHRGLTRLQNRVNLS